MKFSVLIPVYNASKFIEECIQSIYQNDYEDFEVICVDDESTDNSYEILLSLCKKIQE